MRTSDVWAEWFNWLKSWESEENEAGWFFGVMKDWGWEVISGIWFKGRRDEFMKKKNFLTVVKYLRLEVSGIEAEFR